MKNFDILFLLVFALVSGCAVFTPQTPESPSLNQRKTDPLNFREIFSGIPSTNQLYTSDYNQMFSSSFSYYDETGKSPTYGADKISSRLGVIENTANSSDSSGLPSVHWLRSDSSKSEILVQGQITTLLPRSWIVVLNADTFRGEAVFTVEYDPTIDAWKIRSWQDRTTDSHSVSFFDPDWKSQ